MEKIRLVTKEKYVEMKALCNKYERTKAKKRENVKRKIRPVADP